MASRRKKFSSGVPEDISPPCKAQRFAGMVAEKPAEKAQFNGEKQKYLASER
jgi:hypothetical protein